MYTFRHVLGFTFACLLLAGCYSAQPVVVEPPTTGGPSGTPPGGTGQRTLPDPVVLPADFQRAVAEGTRTATGLPGPNYWQQETDYFLTARVLPEQHRLEGTGRIVYTNNSRDTLYTLHLELAQNVHQAGSPRNDPMETTAGVTLQRVAVNNSPLQRLQSPGTGYTVHGTQLQIAPSAPVAPGQTTQIEIDWSFPIAQEGAGGRMGYSGNSLVYLAYWYPVMSVYDDVEGWFTDPFLGRAEFYHGFGDYEVTVEAPAQWVVWGTGTLLNLDQTLTPDVAARLRQAHASDQPMTVLTPASFQNPVTQGGANGQVTWRFEADNVRDFAFSVMRDYNWEAARTPVGDRDGDGDVDYTAINTFYRDAAPLWQDVTQFQQHAITFLSEYTGFAYPWPHMTAVEGAGIIGGGMEYPMMTLIGDYNGAGTQALYNVTAHELAHMWIPMITATNERRYSWIDEGSTTFAENQARTSFYPGPNHNLGDQQQYLLAARNNIEGEMMRWSDLQDNSNAFVIASYNKPGTLLAALRDVLGEEIFNQAYQSFIDTWAYRHPYPYDFFNTFERVSGQDLDWFWHSWYFETWTLDQAVAEVRSLNGSTEIMVEDLGLVTMPVDLEVTLANGQTIERRIPVDVWLQGATRTSITLDTPSAVTRVAIDPDLAFPDINRDNNVWTSGPAAP
jgi:hypothetical protein